MQLSKVAALAVLVPVTVASSCKASSALSWPPAYTPGGGGGSGGGSCKPASPTGSIVDACADCCGNDQDCLQACLKAAGLGRRGVEAEVVGRDGGSTPGLHARADLQCSDSEECYKYTDGSLLCLDLTTGMQTPSGSPMARGRVRTADNDPGTYHDDVGGTGDYNTGVYTAPNGVVQTGTSAPESTQSRAATSAEETSASATRTSSGATSSGVTSTGSGAATTGTNSAGSKKLQVGAVLGAIGLVAGLAV